MYRLLKSIRVLAGLLAMSLLLACTADNKWASDAEVAAQPALAEERGDPVAAQSAWKKAALLD